MGQVKSGKWNGWEFEIRKAKKPLRPRRLSGEKRLPQRRRDAEGLAPKDLPPPILVSRSAVERITAYAGGLAPAERGPTERSVVN